MRALIADVLAREGHEVKSVAHGAAALLLLEQQSIYDLILDDLTIHTIEGAHLFREIGRRWPNLVSRLICLTDGQDAGRSRRRADRSTTRYNRSPRSCGDRSPARPRSSSNAQGSSDEVD